MLPRKAAEIEIMGFFFVFMWFQPNVSASFVHVSLPNKVAACSLESPGFTHCSTQCKEETRSMKRFSVRETVGSITQNHFPHKRVGVHSRVVFGWCSVVVFLRSENMFPREGIIDLSVSYQTFSLLLPGPVCSGGTLQVVDWVYMVSSNFPVFSMYVTWNSQ